MRMCAPWPPCVGLLQLAGDCGAGLSTFTVNNVMLSACHKHCLRPQMQIAGVRLDLELGLLMVQQSLQGPKSDPYAVGTAASPQKRSMHGGDRFAAAAFAVMSPPGAPAPRTPAAAVPGSPDVLAFSTKSDVSPVAASHTLRWRARARDATARRAASPGGTSHSSTPALSAVASSTSVTEPAAPSPRRAAPPASTSPRRGGGAVDLHTVLALAGKPAASTSPEAASPLPLPNQLPDNASEPAAL
jgi:hypothetical protein